MSQRFPVRFEYFFDVFIGVRQAREREVPWQLEDPPVYQLQVVSPQPLPVGPQELPQVPVRPVYEVRLPDRELAYDLRRDSQIFHRVPQPSPYFVSDAIDVAVQLVLVVVYVFHRRIPHGGRERVPAESAALVDSLLGASAVEGGHQLHDVLPAPVGADGGPAPYDLPEYGYVRPDP